MGDAVSEDSSSPPGYLDLKQVKITEQKGEGTFTFTWLLAAPVPDEFGPDDLIELGNLNINPRVTGAEYTVVVRWAGSNQGGNDAFEARLFGDLASWPFAGVDTFSIDGPVVTAVVPADNIGNPESFTWLAAVREKAYVFGDPFEGVTGWAPGAAWGPGGLNPPELGYWEG